MRQSAANKISAELAKIGTIASIAAGLILVCYAGEGSPAYGAAEVKPVAGIRCDYEEYSSFHIHAHLDIFVDGKPYAIPQGVGIMPSQKCLYWVHTHDPSGIIHVESPEARSFTLGQFFEIWKATAPGVPAVKQKPKVFVNGKRASVEWEQVEITDLTEIAVIYGQEPPQVPSYYVFPLEYRKGPYRKPG